MERPHNTPKYKAGRQSWIYNPERFGKNGKYSEIAKQADDLYYYMYQDDEIVQAIEYLDTKLKTKTNGFIEIGSALGGSFHCWASIIEGKKICVDRPIPETNVSTKNVTNYPDFLQEVMINNKFIDNRVEQWNKHFTDVYQVLGDSQDNEVVKSVTEILDGDKVDFLFVDGEHTFEYIKNDFLRYLQFTHDNSIVAFHDIFGIYRGWWGEIIHRFPDNCIEFTSKETGLHDRRHEEKDRDGNLVRGPGIGFLKLTKEIRDFYINFK